MSAFLRYQVAPCLEHCPLVELMPFSVKCAVTSGISSLIGKPHPRSTESSASVFDKTLPDGRMKVGVNMPLLSRRFRYLRLLGEGTSAQVILAEDTYLQKSKVVVIKVMKRHFGSVGQKEACALRFLQARNGASHGALVKLSSAFTYCGHVCLVLERLHGSLLDYVAHSATLHKTQALQNLRKIAMQLLGALALMHSKGIVHADIKPENILMTSPADTGRVGLNLVDLGNCFSVTGTDTSRISFEMQSLPFRAPEVHLASSKPYEAVAEAVAEVYVTRALLGGACGTGIDVWSLGCLLAEVALQRPLFPVATTAELTHQMFTQLGPFPTALTALTNPQTRAHSLSSQGRGPQASCPTDQPGHQSQQANGRASIQHPQGKHQQSAGSLSIQIGNLDMLHETACPLHLELARVEPTLASLVMAMLRYDPEQRVSAGEALRHPFLSELSPVLQLLAAQREAGARLPQGKAVGGIETHSQGTFQQGCPAEAVSDQAASTLRPGRQSGLPFKPEPRRQPIASLPTRGHPTAQAAVPSWADARLPMHSDPLLQAAQPQLHTAQLQVAQPHLQAAQPQLQASQPQLQVGQPQLQPPQSTLQPLPGQGLVTSLPDRTAGSSRVIQLPTVMPAVVPSARPSADKAAWPPASSGVATCTLPAHQANSLSAPLAVGGSPTTADLPTMPCHTDQRPASKDVAQASVLGQNSLKGVTLEALGGRARPPLRQGQGEPTAVNALDSRKLHAEEVAGLGAVGTPQALAQGPVKTPGLVKAWNGVTELLQQMSPASQVKPPPRSLAQALQAARPSATLPYTHPPVSPPPAQPPLLCPTSGQTQQCTRQQLSSQQQQEKEVPALRMQPKQQLKRPKGQPQTDCSALPTASKPTNSARLSGAAITSSTQREVELNPDEHLGVGTGAGQDMPFSQQSHVSVSPNTSSLDGQAASQQQQHPGQTVTIADSAAQSNHGTGASQGHSDSRLVTDQPVLSGSPNQADQAERAVGARHQGLPEAALTHGITAEPQERGTREGLTSSGAQPAALEPAGPAQSGGDGVLSMPTSIDKTPQLSWQLPKHEARVSQVAGVQTPLSTVPVPCDMAPEQRSRLQETAGIAAEQKSRNVSREASAVPAESQQSAVHAGLPAPPPHSMPVKHSALRSKHRMQAAGGQTPLDGRTASSKAKRSRAEVAVGPADVKAVEQSRKLSRPRLDANPPTGKISQLGKQTVGTGSPQVVGCSASETQDGAGGLCEGAEEDCPGPWPPPADQAPDVQYGLAQSTSMELHSKGCDATGQSAKRSLRKRDSDANKPWWVV